MRISGYILRAVLALIIGSIYFYPLAWIWGYIVIHNPLFDYILDLARNGMPISFRIAVYIQDFFINLIVMFPLVFIIFRLKPPGNWVYIILALIACEATEMFPVRANLKSYFDNVGFFEYLLASFLTSGPALLGYWILKKRLHLPPNKKRNGIDTSVVSPSR